MAIADRATVTLNERQLADVAAAAVAPDNGWKPERLKEAVEEDVPDIVRSVAGCKITPRALTLYVECGKGLSFYLTTTGRLSRTADGGLEFELDSAWVGIIPVPRSLLDRAGATKVKTIMSPADAGARIGRLTMENGRLTLELIKL